MLPAGFEIGTGKIVNRIGEQSAEIDLVIHNRSVLPPIMYGQREGIFPVESSYYAIEVKSTITATTVRDAVANGRTVIDLTEIERQDGQRSNRSPTVLVLFGFSSDLTESTTELERYATYDPQWQHDPVLKAICVVGRGYWYHRAMDDGWAFHAPSEQYDEVIDFVAGIVNTSLKHPPSMRTVPLGEYLCVVRETPLIRGQDS